MLQDVQKKSLCISYSPAASTHVFIVRNLSLPSRCSKTKAFAGVFKLLKKLSPFAACCQYFVPVWPRPAEDGGHTQASVEPTTVVVRLLTFCWIRCRGGDS